MIKNIFLIILVLFSLSVQALEKTSSKDSRVIVPKNNRFLEWDTKNISVATYKNELVVYLKGKVLVDKVGSFAYQVVEGDARKINLKNKHFEIEVIIHSVPSVIRFWLEHKEGKGVKLESYEVKIEESEPELSKEKLINY